MMNTANLEIEVTRRFIIPGTSPEAISARIDEQRLSISSKEDLSLLINQTCQVVLNQIHEFSSSDEARQIDPKVKPSITRAKYSLRVLEKTRESCEELFPKIMAQPLNTNSGGLWNWIANLLS